MSCTVVNSQSQLQTRLPSLPQTLPTTQGQWTSFLNTLTRWGIALQQKNHPPNVIPSQFQTFTSAASSAVVGALTVSDCTPSIDTGTQYYGAASLKVTISATGATLAFTGYPISIAAATRWFGSFQIMAPNGCAGSLTVKTSAHTLTESFSVDASDAWQQVWGLFDLRPYADTQATWEFTFTSTDTVWLDGLQMNAVGDPIASLPSFSGTQMVTGDLAYADNLDDVADGETYSRTLGAYVAEGVPYNYRGAWDSETAYAQGAEVSSGGNYYLAVAASTNEEPPNADYWQLLGPTTLDDVADGEDYSKVLESYVASGVPYSYKGAWSASTSYVQGDEVSSGGNYYLATAASSDEEPPNDSYWKLLGPATLDDVVDGSTYSRVLAAYVSQGIAYNYLGAWSSSTAYSKGAEVSSGGNYYLAIAASTNKSPPNATYWKLLGPASLDSVADGSTYGRFLLSGLSGGIATTEGLTANAATAVYTNSCSDVDIQTRSTTVNCIAISVGPFDFATTVVVTATGFWAFSSSGGGMGFDYGISDSDSSYTSYIGGIATAAVNYGPVVQELTYSLPANTSKTYYLNAGTPPVTGDSLTLTANMKCEVIKR